MFTDQQSNNRSIHPTYQGEINGQKCLRRKKRTNHDAWGNVLTATGNLADVNPLRYRGYYFDTETGFYYLQSRYYDPIVKRFLNADSYASTGQGFVGYNMFAYCGNGPINCYDPSGTQLVIITPEGNGLFVLIYKIKYQFLSLLIISCLTDDELKIDSKTGKVSVSKEADSPKKEVGTGLIRSLCNEDNTIYVGISPVPVVEAGKYIGSTTSALGPYPGECDSVIIIDPVQAKIENIGAEIILGHEMIHAYHDATNTNVWSDKYQEECHTVGLGPYAIQYYNENALRAENGYPNRTKY